MIFVDTSFWVALSNRRVERFGDARRLSERHADGGLVASNHVIGETWAFLRRRAGHAAAVSFLDMVATSPRVGVVRVSEAAEARALDWLSRHDERGYSYVDSTSFDVMRTSRMREGRVRGTARVRDR